MTSYREMASPSPYSSSDHGYSAKGTPDTSLTAFSPEEAKPSRPSNTLPDTGGASLVAGQHDPFITTMKPTGRSLSATASSFRPLGGKETKAGSLQEISVSSAAHVFLPKNGSRVSSAGGSVSSSTQVGTFSTDTGVRRNLKISAIYESEVKPLVDASIKVYTTHLTTHLSLWNTNVLNRVSRAAVSNLLENSSRQTRVTSSTSDSPTSRMLRRSIPLSSWRISLPLLSNTSASLNLRK